MTGRQSAQDRMQKTSDTNSFDKPAREREQRFADAQMAAPVPNRAERRRRAKRQGRANAKARAEREENHDG